MLFKEIVGQENTAKILRNNIEKRRVAHAQLFEGKNGYGTFAMAVAYIQYLNCRNKTAEDACGQCVSCRKIAALEHPDVHLVFPVNKSPLAENVGKNDAPISDNLISLFREYALENQLYIDAGSWYEKMELSSKNAQPIISKKEADNILEKLQYTPLESPFVHFIIWLPETMNASAANTLLKQFEEPENNAVFIFVTENTSVILPTILSRVQQTNIPPVEKTYITYFLQQKYPQVNPEELQNIAAVSQGDIIKAVSLFESTTISDPIFESFKELMRACYQNNHLKLLDWVEDFSTLSFDEIKSFFISSLSVLRNSFMENEVAQQFNHSFAEKRVFISRFHPYIDNNNIEPLIREFEAAFGHIQKNGNIKIVMTDFVLSITKLIR